MISRVDGNTHPENQLVAVHSKPGTSEIQTRFVDLFAELKLASREGNRLNVEITIPETPDDETVAYERVSDGKIVHFSELMVYQAPEQPELIEVIPPKPTYAESIRDVPIAEWISLCSAARDVCCDTLNTEGMTKGEIYNEIRAVFEDYLGKDFLEPFYTRSGSYDDLEFYAPAGVFDGFTDTLKRFGIDYHDSSVRVKAAGYSGMSNDEIKTAVREKYPKVMTLRECIVMGWELYEMGVTSHNYGAGIESLVGNATLNEVSNGVLKDTRTEMYNLLLDYPADFDRIVSNCDQKNANGERFFRAQIQISPMERVMGLFKVSGSSAYTADMLIKLMRML